MLSAKTATALLCDAYVKKGGRRAEAKDSDAVHIYLMNVLSASDTNFDVRCRLLERVLDSIEPTGRVVLPRLIHDRACGVTSERG